MESIQISKKATNNTKGLACLLIVAHHFCSILMGRGFDNWLISFIGVRGGVMGVTIFFFLSAWGLSESQSKKKYSFSIFVKRRLSKVYLPLIISSSIYYFILLSSGTVSFNPTKLLLYILNIKPIDAVLWFCNTILIFYLIFFFSFLPEKKLAKISICLASTLLYSVLSTIFFPNSPFYVYSVIGFLVGMICSLYKDRLLKISFCGGCSMVITLFLLSGAVLFPDYRNLFLMNFFSFILLVLLIFVIQIIHYSDKLFLLPFIGIYSYEIYLIHNKVLIPFGNNGYITWYPLVFVLIVIPLSILLNRLIKVIMRK